MKITGEGYNVFRRRSLGMTIIAVAMLVFISLFASNADAVSKVITVYADGYERTIQTEAATVAEALEKADVTVGAYDLVEPGLDTEIIEPIFSVNVYRARPVTVVDGDTVRQVMTPYKSERLIAADAGVVVYPEDRFTLERVDDIVESGIVGQRLLIIRAKAVTIDLYGEKYTHRTHLDNVADVLAEAGISLGEGDHVKPGADARVKDSLTLRIIHTGTRVVTEEVPIAFETEYIFDSNRMVGEEEVKEAGRDGVRIVTYEVTIENNKVVKRKEIQSVVKTKPQTAVMIVGTKNPDPSSNVSIGQSMAASRGWVGAEWQCLYNLWMKESGWNHLASNSSSGAYGIPQSLPGSKMAANGADWESNPATQIAWGLDYIAGRYGTPCAAWAQSESIGWY